MQLITKQEYYQKIREANGYCLLCQRPLKLQFSKIHCATCSKNQRHNGYEDKSVNIPIVGKSTINYQQHLHRAIFRCNADYRYRGTKEERIITTLTQEQISIATNKLDILLLRTCKQYQLTQEQNRNPKRILYYTILYYIAYYILNLKDFKTDNHFYLSMYKAIRYIVHNHHYKSSHIKLMGYNEQYNYQDVRRDIPVINSIISPLLTEFVV